MVRFLMRNLLWLCLVILPTPPATVTAADLVSIEQGTEGIVVKTNGEEFIVLHQGPTLPKPYFWPVRAAGGAILTRPINPNEADHRHHRGIWLSVDEVNDIKFWAESGKIATREVTFTSGNPGTIQLTNDWLKSEGVPALIEKTKISIYPNRLVIYDTTLAPPAGQQARFDDTKEGFFGIRIAQSMREKEGGIVVNSEGQKTTQQCWGQPAKWVDYTGPVDGKNYGIALMDHPGNFRPSRYHVRDYGLFSISPFGEGAYQSDIGKAKPVVLDAARPSLRMRYGLYVHDGGATEGKVADAYNEFLQATK